MVVASSVRSLWQPGSWRLVREAPAGNIYGARTSGTDLMPMATAPTTEKMTSAADDSTEAAHGDEPAVIIAAAEFEAARRDPRVREFLDDAARYRAELEVQGRNR